MSFSFPVGLLKTAGDTNGFTTRLQVDDACSLAALGALSFDAGQAMTAEWYDTYPNVPRTIPDSAVRRAASFSSPPPLDEDARASRAQRMLKRMDAEALSAYSAVVYAALGSDRAAMSLIADIAKREIDWQLALLRPMYTVLRPPLGPPAPQSAAAAAADKVAQPWPRNLKRKRTSRAPEALRVPDIPSPRKRSKLASGAYCSTVPDRSETPPPADSQNEEVDVDEGDGDGEGEGGDEEDHAPTHGGRLWQRLAIGWRRLPPASEGNEEESTAPVGHAREEVPEFGPAGPCQSGLVMTMSAANGGRIPHRDSDLAQFEPHARTGELD